jgi:hypothetical protein
MSVITLFASQVGDATSSAGRVRPVTGNTHIERLMFFGSGTWGDDTNIMFLELSLDNVNWAFPTDCDAYPINRYDANFSSLVDIPSGMYFRVSITGNDSPVTSTLSCKVFGDVVAV